VLLRIGLASEGESQAALWDRLLRLRPSFFRGYSSGDLQSRVMVVHEIGRDLSTTTLSTLFSSVLAILNLSLLVYYSPALSVMALAVGFLVLAFTTTISLRMRKTLRKLVEVEGVFFGMVVQLINGVGKLRVAGAQDRAYTHWVRQFADQLKMLDRVYRLQEHNVLFNQVLPTLTSAVLFLISFEMLIEGRAVGHEGLTLGTFMAFNIALTTFLMGITGLSSASVKFMDILAKGKRIQPILEADAEVDLTKADPGLLTGRIEMYDVEFSYEEDGPKILDGVHLHAEPGEFIALVGPSGSGKSTIFRTLLGFETAQSGSILYGGQDISNLDVLAVRRQLGVVLQGGTLDAGSVFDNIASGNVIALDDAWAAAEDAGCAQEIREMPMNMHTMVSVGGTNLSGGQRQRILIARALAHRPRILLFDEATSALDNRTQATVSESLEKLNVTRLVVAHRLSTIRNADRIYVLERGKIVQSGSFADLMQEEGGLFARMMKRQIA
jgi:ATP-binding cassette subfamily C protein